jgi:hypothetical protein
MLETSETLADKGSQDSNFLSLVKEGNIYEYVKEHFGGKYFDNGFDRFLTRNLTKREFMRLMYFDTRKEKTLFYKPFRQFAELFPLEADVMRLIKKCGYQRFPVLLQMIESKLMLEKVGENMPEDVPFLTIHDSLIIPSSENIINTASQLIQSQFQRYLTIAPTLGEPEVLTPEYAFDTLDKYIAEKVTNLEIRHSIGKEEIIEDYSY